tara:strand:+ start:124 stop:438 length:315 start_codon:yes stop_codon:yes gene_type:complete
MIKTNKIMEENNKLIAEFMDLSIKEGVCYYTDADDMFPMGIEVEAPYIPYDDYWNWLMPVVEKIKDMGYDQQLDNIDNVLTCDLRIENLYNAVVEFIKFYNQNK